MKKNEEKEFNEWLKRAGKSSGDKIKDSAVFMSLFTANYEKDPLAALQLGIAIMLDKPIYILAEQGKNIPENVLRLSRGIEYFNPAIEGDLQAAGTRLLQNAKELQGHEGIEGEEQKN